jgi:hypothetical protein
MIAGLAILTLIRMVSRTPARIAEDA